MNVDEAKSAVRLACKDEYKSLKTDSHEHRTSKCLFKCGETLRLYRSPYGLLKSTPVISSSLAVV